tara:strand:- start:228 stop:428 length:201 start_codon:yes stop_codon:yes gene_type:complete
MTRKFTDSKEFVDLCGGCSKFLIEDDVTIEGNLDYAHLSDIEESYDVEDGELDSYSGRELGDEELW